MEPGSEPGSWLAGPAAGGRGHLVSIRLRGTCVMHVTVPSAAWLGMHSFGCSTSTGLQVPRRLRSFMQIVQAWMRDLACDPFFFELPAGAVSESTVSELLHLRPYVVILRGDLRFTLLQRGGLSYSISIDMKRCCFWFSAGQRSHTGSGARLSIRRARPRFADALDICSGLSVGRDAFGGDNPPPMIPIGVSRTAHLSDEWTDTRRPAPESSRVPTEAGVQHTFTSRRATRFGLSRIGKRLGNKVAPQPVETAKSLPRASRTSSTSDTHGPLRPTWIPLPVAIANTSVQTRPDVSEGRALSRGTCWYVEHVVSLTTVLVCGCATAAGEGGGVGLPSGRLSSVNGSESLSCGSCRGNGSGISHVKRMRALRRQLWHLWIHLRTASPAELVRWRDAGLVVALLEVLATAPSILAHMPPLPAAELLRRSSAQAQSQQRAPLADSTLSAQACRGSETVVEADTEPDEAAAVEAIEEEEALEESVGLVPPGREDGPRLLPPTVESTMAELTGFRCAWMSLRVGARDAAMEAASAAMEAADVACDGPTSDLAKAAAAADAAALSVQASEIRAENRRGGVCSCCTSCKRDADAAGRQWASEYTSDGRDALSLASARGCASLSDVWWLPESLIGRLLAGDVSGGRALAANASQLLCAGRAPTQLLWSVRAWLSLAGFLSELTGCGGLDAIADITILRTGGSAMSASVLGTNLASTVYDGANCVTEDRQLVATQILAVAAHQPMARPIIERIAPSLYELLFASQLQWPRLPQPSPCWREAAMMILSLSHCPLPHHDSSPVQEDNAAVSHVEGLTDPPIARYGRAYQSEASPLPPSFDVMPGLSRSSSTPSAVFSRIATQLRSCLPRGASQLNPAAASETSALLRLISQYLHEHASSHSSAQLHRLLVAPLGTLCQQLIGSAAIAASPRMKEDEMKVTRLELTCATLRFAHVLYAQGTPNPGLRECWISLFARSSAVLWAHENAKRMLSTDPGIVSAARAHFGSWDAGARLLRDGRAAVAQHLCALAHAAMTSSPSLSFSLPELWQSAAVYVLPYFAAKARGDCDPAYSNTEGSRAGDAMRSHQLEAARNSGGRCEALLLRLVVFASEHGALIEPVSHPISTDRTASSKICFSSSMADLAEALWQRGVGLYATTEAALRWGVARGACEPSADMASNVDDLSAEKELCSQDADGRNSNNPSGSTRTPLPSGLAMRARLTAHYFAALGSIAARRDRAVAARLSALGVARSLVTEVSLEQQLPMSRIPLPAPAPSGIKAPRIGGPAPAIALLMDNISTRADERAHAVDCAQSDSSSDSGGESPPMSRVSRPTVPSAVPRLLAFDESDRPSEQSTVPPLGPQPLGSISVTKVSHRNLVYSPPSRGGLATSTPSLSAVPKLRLSFSAGHEATTPSSAPPLQPHARFAHCSPGTGPTSSYTSPAVRHSLTGGRDCSRLSPRVSSLPTPSRPSARPSRLRPTCLLSQLGPSSDVALGSLAAGASLTSPLGISACRSAQHVFASKLETQSTGSTRSVFSILGGELTPSQYAAERAARLLYACPEIHRSVLLLLTYLFVASNGLSLDTELAEASRFRGQVADPTASGMGVSQSAHLAFEAHINHPSNAPLLPDILATASACGEAYGVLLRLVFSPAFDNTAYKVGQTIARGAFGAVYSYERRSEHEAVHSGDASDHGHPRVVKLLPKATSRFSRSNLPDVFIEVLSLRRLKPAGVAVDLLDFGCDASSFYLVMPRYTHTLRSWRRDAIQTRASATGSEREADARCPLRHILALYAQAISAVARMRSLGIEHFDIKADNFLLRKEQSLGAMELGDDAAADDVAAADGLRLVVADLGVAKLYEVNDAGCSPRDRGTECIKSPEMLEVIQRSGLQSSRSTARGAEGELGGGGAHDGSTIDREWAVPGACDVWACGCLLYETITGDYLFEESDWFQFYLRITASDHPLLTPANLSQLPAPHADAIAGFLCRVLERDPRKRMHIEDLRKDFVGLRLHLLSESRHPQTGERNLKLPA